MIKIGIISKKQNSEIKNIITTLFKIAKKNLVCYDIDNNFYEKNAEIFMIKDIEYSNCMSEKFNILIVNAENSYEYIDELVAHMTTSDYLIIDADDKNIILNIKHKNCNIITCGFSSKACITTSSVFQDDYKTIQICILRSFKSIYNATIDMQEFSLDVSSYNNEIFNILSAVTTGLICGIVI